jgi:hypothetical protein
LINSKNLGNKFLLVLVILQKVLAKMIHKSICKPQNKIRALLLKHPVYTYTQMFLVHTALDVLLGDCIEQVLQLSIVVQVVDNKLQCVSAF